jgi:hypothetical protein
MGTHISEYERAAVERRLKRIALSLQVIGDESHDIKSFVARCRDLVEERLTLQWRLESGAPEQRNSAARA